MRKIGGRNEWTGLMYIQLEKDPRVVAGMF